MVLAKLAGGVTQRLEQLGDRRVFLLQALRRAGQTDLGVAGAEHTLSGDERGSAGRAALLAIIVGEYHPLARDAVDIRGAKAHQAEGVGAYVGLSDVVTPDHQDIRPAPGGSGSLLGLCYADWITRRDRGCGDQGRAAEQNAAPVGRAIVRCGLGLVSIVVRAHNLFPPPHNAPETDMVSEVSIGSA